jgi:hypothetical protein
MWLKLNATAKYANYKTYFHKTVTMSAPRNNTLDLLYNTIPYILDSLYLFFSSLL